MSHSRLFILSMLVSGVLSSNSAHAISEANYASQFESQVLPHFLNQGKPGSFLGVDQVPIAYRVFEQANEKGALVILPGRTEPMTKYAEVIYDLSDLGYSIYIMDHRGQGFSGRMVDNTQVGYVRRFEDYVKDVETFVSTVVNAKAHSKKILMAHSMGGAVSALYMANHSNEFQSAILVSPMMKVDTGKFPNWLATTVTSLSKKKKYAMGKGDYDPSWPFDGNDVTHSEARFESSKKLFEMFPESKLGGPSNGWVKQAIRGARKSRLAGKKVKIPVLLFQGTEDTIVKSKGSDKFCKRTKTCTVMKLEGARHEILMEADSIRTPAMERIRGWLSN